MALDLLSPDAVRDPYPLFAALHAEAPVQWNERYGAWMVLGYREVLDGFRNRALSSDRILPADGGQRLPPRLRAALEVLSRWLVFKDPPDHSRLRRLVMRSFTSRAVDRIRDRIEAIVAGLLERCPGRGFDLVEQLAYPLPAIVIAELLGAPAEDRELFRQWSDGISGLVFGSAESGEARDRSAEALLSFADYFSDLIRRYEAAPAENLLSSLIHARDNDDALSHDEVLATAILVLFAGHETTTNLIANGIYHLLRAPDQKRLLLREPALIEPAVEEFLRFDGPSKIAVRHTAAETEIGGQAMPAGARVFLVQASANRDPAAFAEPDRLDVTRSPNPHLGFGHGVHFCVGAPLARFEAQVAIRALLQRFPTLELAEDEPAWEPVLLNRGPLALHVAA